MFESALPGYPGGKRKLLPAIAALLNAALPRTEWKTATFADAFLGGGSVSLWAKASGFAEVHANDLAERGAVVGRALIANSHLRITPPDVLSLLTAVADSGDTPGLLKRVESPTMVAFLGAARTALRDLPVGARKDLLTVLVLQVAIRYFPLGLPSASDGGHVSTGEFDRVSGPRLAHYLDTGRALIRPASLLRRSECINRAVLPGTGVASKLDAFDFLPQVHAAVAYLDPPYTGTQGYERAFRLIDDYLDQPPLPPSRFTGKAPPLDELLDVCRHIPVVLLSLNNAVFTEAELQATVAKHRTVQRFLSIPYRHYAPIASASKNATNREFLVLATRKLE